MPKKTLKRLRQLKKNATPLLLGALIIAVPLAVLLFINPRKAQAAWYDYSYGHRQALTITNNGTTQTSWPVQINIDTATLVGAGKMQSDCDDARFALADGTELTYFLEAGCNTSNTIFWVEIPSIESGLLSIYFYYSNTAATSASNFIDPAGAVNYGNGADGDITISADTNINTTSSISGRSCADGGDAVNYTVTENRSAGTDQIVLSSTPSTGCLAVGDEILIINLMGTSGANGNVGKWETARITAISTATLTLNHDLINAYDGTTQQIMVQRIPNYNDVTLSNSGTDFTANDFNGTKNGVMMFRANGTVTVAANTTINTNSMGYRGGAAGSGGAVGGTNGESYDGTVGSGGSGSNAGTSGGGDGGGNDTTAPAGVVRGGGGGGGASGGTSSSNNAGAGGGGGYGYGGGGGGAGRDGTGTSGSGGSAASASINAGGGGGGRNTSGNGGNGGNAGSAGTSSTGSGGAVGSGTTSGGGGGGSNNAGGSGGGGGGGGSYGSSTLDRIFFGSGGGGGGDSVVSGTATAGADGGGIVYIGANTVSVSGSVQANGGTADTGSTDRAGTGGSGSGGSVYITGASVTLGTNLVTATGGGVVTGGTSTAGGGAGGDGRIYVTYSTVSGSTNPTATTAALPVAGSISNEENAPTLTGAKLYWKLDTGYGTVANDSSNYGNSGTISNAVWRDESYCKNGKCLYFDGAGDLVSRANDNEVNFAASDDFTIMGWFRHPTIATSADYIVAKHASGTAGGYKIYMDSDGDIAFGIDDDGTWDPEDVIGDDQSRNYDDSRWHHFAAVKDGTTGIYLYIDGELVDSDTALAATGSLSNETAFYVGVDADGSSNGWDGFLDEIKIFDEVRSIGEIRADMQPSAPEEGASASFGSRELASLSDGLVAYWKMDESAWSGVSGEVVDSSGNGNHGTAAGTPPTTGQGRYNQGGVFNGTNDYINCGTNSSITGLTAFTFATWVKTSASSGTPLLSFSSNSTTLQIENPTNRSLLLLGPNNYRYFSNSTVNLGDGEWHHVVFTIPGSSQLDILKSKMYVDGVLQANSTDVSTGEQNSKTSCLISRYATAYFNGTQDEIRLYNRELSKEEVLALYQFAPKPILHYKFDENTGTTTAYDYAGSGNDLTLTNMTANSWQQGKFGSSLLFNRSSAQYATGSDSAATSITEDLTLSAWIKPKTTTLSTEYDIAGKRNADSLSYLLTQYGDELRFYIDSTSNYVETSATNLSTNTWYHVEAVYKAADQSAKIYVNGVQQTTTTTGTIPTSISDNSDAFYVSNYTNGVETVIDRQVSTGTDDAHAGSIENDVGRNVATAGVLATGDAVLAPGSHESNDEYSAGARFTNITIPQGTDIVNAIFTLTVDVAWDASPDTVSYHVSGQDADDAPTFGGVGDSLDTTERPRTTADAGPWDQTTTDNAGDEESLVVTDVVQEIIDRPGWSSGNALVMLIDTTAATTQAQWQEYESYEGSSSLAPKLSITYSTGASNYYDGDIDEVKLYNYARNSSQIIEDMNGGHPVGGSPISSKVIQYNFDEQNGSTANNSNPTQSGITGSISGASWLLSNNCKYNGCLDFDGTDDVVTVTNASPIDFDTGLASAFTISAWINPDTDGEADTGQIFQKGTNTWCRTDNESGGNVDIECSLDLATTDATVNVSAAVPTNTWSHFAIAYTDDTDDEITVYINGVAMGSSTNGVGAPAGSDSNNLLIGGTTANNFDGSIDDFKVYASELTASQILIDKNANAATSIGTGTTKSSLLSGGAGNPPIAWITFDDNTGTSAKDVSGSGNTCTLTSMPTNPWVKGKYGTALDFQKTNDIASCGSAAALDNLSALTVEAWIKPRASSTYEQIVAKAETAAPANGWLFESNMANNNLEFWVDYATDDLVRISANNVLVDDVWQHVAVTWTGSSTATNAKLYVNGKEVSYTTTTNAAGARNDDDAGTLTIGNDVTTTDDFDGAIDEVKVYNYVRTPQQIAFDYSQGKPIGWWKLDECTGGTANDSSGSGNTGTITIGATGSNTATGTCSSGTGTEAWNNGTTGKFNGSLDFDGTNDYVTTTDSRHLSASQGTVSLWFNHDDTGSGLELMFAHRAATESGNNRIYLGVTTSDTLAVGIGDVSTQDTGDAITNGSWHMGTLTWDNGNYYAYLDGNLVHSGTYTNFTGIATCLVIGAYGQNCAGFNSYFDGQIDDVRVYNYALTQSEILTIKNQGAAIRFGQ